jgi:hydroxymethylglutaryl-CoA reductase
MKMHLLNILNQNDASEAQKIKAVDFFKTNAVTHNAVSNFLNTNP